MKWKLLLMSMDQYDHNEDASYIFKSMELVKV